MGLKLLLALWASCCTVILLSIFFWGYDNIWWFTVWSIFSNSWVWWTQYRSRCLLRVPLLWVITQFSFEPGLLYIHHLFAYVLINFLLLLDIVWRMPFFNVIVIIKIIVEDFVFLKTLIAQAVYQTVLLIHNGFIKLSADCLDLVWDKWGSITSMNCSCIAWKCSWFYKLLTMVAHDSLELLFALCIFLCVLSSAPTWILLSVWPLNIALRKLGR